MHTEADTALAIYRKMVELSEQMVESACSQNWEELARQEQSLADHRDKLASLDVANMSMDERTASIALIKRILANQEEVQKYVAPWLDHVRQYLGNAATKRKVAQAYGVDPSSVE